MKKRGLSSKNFASPIDQGVDFIELFFDLVFVYAITRITFLTAHHLDVKHVLQGILIFWLVWWGWTQFTWALNAANTKFAKVRVMVLIATGVAFFMASSIKFAFTDAVLWFAIPYILIRIIGIILYIRVTTNLKGQNTAVLLFALLSMTGLVAVLAGAFVSPSLRVYFWLSAIALDMLASFIAGRSDGWNLNSKHFAERHGLIVIIALGESLIVAGSAVSNGNVVASTELIIVGILAVLVTCLLWWSYFSWIHEKVDESFSKKEGAAQAMAARDAFSLMHFPLICGIIGIAIGFEKILQHPNEVLSLPVAAALGGGYLLYIGFTTLALWRSSNIILIPRFILLGISLIGIIYTIGYPSKYALSVIAMSLFLMFIIEWKMCKHKEDV